MSDDPDTYPRATPLTQEQSQRAYAHAPELLFCKNGHALSDDNMSMQMAGNGKTWTRTCRQCNRERAKEWRLINKDRLERKPGGSGKTLRRSYEEFPGE